MTWEIILLLVLIGCAATLFVVEWVSPDVVSLGLLVAITLTGLLPVQRAFEGFGSNTVVTVFALFVLTAALRKTGFIDLVSRWVVVVAGTEPNRVLVVMMLAVSGLSAFMSNTASTALFVPVALGLASRAKIPPSKFLMPLAFSSILSSSVTLISTSTNLVISDLMTGYRLAPMGLFELTPVGVPIAIAGVAYMIFIGRRFIPDRGGGEDLIERFGVRPYLSEVLVLPNSKLIGKTLAESKLGQELDLKVLQIVRNKDEYLDVDPWTRIKPLDVLLVEGVQEEILKIKDTSGIEIKADVKLAQPTLQSADVRLVEALVVPHSPLIGRSLKTVRFRERYGLQVLGINRHGENLVRKVSQLRLRLGDILLLQGHKATITALRDDEAFHILGSVGEARPNRRKAFLAASIFGSAILLGASKLVPMPVAAIIGAVAVFVTGCITPDDAYREVEWKAVILVACMLALGVAMETTGTAKWIAASIVHWTQQISPLWLLAGFFLITVILTQPMSNQAAAVVILPIALQTAAQLGLNGRCFAMMIAVAASCSYLTPLEPSCLLVYGPGRYRFLDFARVGALLTVVTFVIALLLVPRVWPLR